MKEVWSETKKEYEVDETGKRILKLVTTEREFKIRSWKTPAALFFQSISSMGIVIIFCGIIVNIFLQSYQNRNQIRLQKNLYSIGLYNKAISTNNLLFKRITRNESDSLIKSTLTILNEEIKPTFELLNNTKIVGLYESLIDSCEKLVDYRKLAADINVIEFDLRNFNLDKNSMREFMDTMHVVDSISISVVANLKNSSQNAPTDTLLSGLCNKLKNKSFDIMLYRTNENMKMESLLEKKSEISDLCAGILHIVDPVVRDMKTRIVKSKQAILSEMQQSNDLLMEL